MWKCLLAVEIQDCFVCTTNLSVCMVLFGFTHNMDCKSNIEISNIEQPIFDLLYSGCFSGKQMKILSYASFLNSPNGSGLHKKGIQ